jgi:hypothetical protein
MVHGLAVTCRIGKKWGNHDVHGMQMRFGTN